MAEGEVEAEEVVTPREFIASLAHSPEVLSELRELLLGVPVANEEAVYSSYKLPPDIGSRRRFREIAKTLPGAVKRGAAWIVPVKVWSEARSKGRAKPQVSADQIAEAALKAAGFRRMK